MKSERYDNLDGLRTYAAIGIVMMHVLANGNYNTSGFIFDKLIPSFTNFTCLFMIVSAFSMCCGYYQRFKNRSIDLEYFYKRRYQKIWPYFAALCTLALIMSLSPKSVYEYLADLTLAFGFIPNNGIEIIGVGWFLGVVFIFYMLFPFFTFLISSKKKAWFSFLICLMLNVLCIVRFTDAANRTVFIYSAVFFMAGGLVYLYRRHFKRRKIAAITGILAVAFLILEFAGYSLTVDLSWLLIFTTFLIFSISIGRNAAFSNKATSFLNSISMEIYLSHMVIYRLLEKLHMTKLIGGGTASYVLTVVLVVIGTIVFSLIVKKLLSYIEQKIVEAKEQNNESINC